MSSNLSVDLKEGFRQTAARMSESELRLGALAHLTPQGASRPRGKRLQEVVLAYRQGPRATWAPVLLELMAPSLVWRLQRLWSATPSVDAEDIRQQLILELLRAGVSMPLPPHPSYLRRWLMARANQGVRRWLVKELRRKACEHPLETLEAHLR